MAIMTPEEARTNLTVSRIEILEKYISEYMEEAISEGKKSCEVIIPNNYFDLSLVYDMLTEAGYKYFSDDFLRVNEDKLPKAWWSHDEGTCCTYTTVTVTICWS